MLDWLTLLAAGAMTFLTPCILPLIPIYLAALSGGSVTALQTAPRGILLARATCFCLGFASVFVALGVAASHIAGALLAHRAALQALGGALVLLFALKYLGWVQIPALDRVVRSQGQAASRYAGVNAWIMGALFAGGWSPCVGPILGSVLTYTASTTANPWRGAEYLGIYGLGLALPLLLTAALVEPALRALRRVRPYFQALERVTGAALLAVAGWLLVGGAPALEDAGPHVARAPVQGPEFTATRVLGGPRMLELYSKNCDVCREMMPVVQTVAEECDGAVRVEQINVSAPANRALVGRYRLVGVPTFLFIDAEGKEAARLIGRQSPDSLRQAMAALRGEACPGVEPVPLLPVERPLESCGLGPQDSCG